MPAPSIVQYFTGNNYGTSTTATSGSNIQSGNVLLAYQQGNNSVMTMPANPSGCVTWTQAAQGTINTTETATWSVGPIISGGACTVTLTATGSSGGIFMYVWELTGVKTVVDGTPGFGYGNAAGVIAGPNVITLVNGDLLIAAMAWLNGTMTPNSPLVDDLNSTSIQSLTGLTGGDLSHYVQPSAGSFTAQYTASSGQLWAGIIALEPSGFQPDEDFWVAPSPAPVDSIISIF